MGINPDDIKQNIKNPETWERAIPMLVYFTAYYFVVQVILITIMLAQFIAQLLFKKRLEHLFSFSVDLINYGRNLWLVLTYTSERKLFPFTDWEKSCQLEEPSSDYHAL